MSTVKKRKNSIVQPGSVELKNKRVLVKNYMRIQEAIDLYSLGLEKVRELAIEAGALYKIDSIVLINIDLFETNLQNYRL